MQLHRGEGLTAAAIALAIVTSSASFPPIGYLPAEEPPALLPSKREPRVERVSADCLSESMRVSLSFNGSFQGLVYSSGYAHDEHCVYVNGTGQQHYQFQVGLDTCGTLGPESHRLMWNTLTVQYDSHLEQEVDEHFQVTCEYGYEFRRTVTLPVIGIRQREQPAAQLVTLPPPQCHMEVRRGFAPDGEPLQGAVSVGDPLTLLVRADGPLDVAVGSCSAHGGTAEATRLLVDAQGCVLEERLLVAPFRGAGPGRAYAFLKAFRFTGSPALYLECEVHLCHGSCPPRRCHFKSRRDLAAATTSNGTSVTLALQVSQERLPPARETKSGGGCLQTPVPAALLGCLAATSALCLLLCLKIRRIKQL